MGPSPRSWVRGRPGPCADLSLPRLRVRATVSGCLVGLGSAPVLRAPHPTSHAVRPRETRPDSAVRARGGPAGPRRAAAVPGRHDGWLAHGPLGGRAPWRVGSRRGSVDPWAGDRVRVSAEVPGESLWVHDPTEKKKRKAGIRDAQDHG